jgi:feruloyl-CoA synthase
MIASNQAAIATFWPFLAQRPPILVDWLPWHHVFGGLDNIFKMIWNGGSLHVDSAPSMATLPTTMQLIERTAPTIHIGVPLGIKLLLDRIEGDPVAAKAFTRNLEAIFFAGAGIDSVLWNRLVRFRDAFGAFEIVSGYGATEAASTICLSPAPLEQPGELGHPLPGHEVCLAETDGRLELRVRGPNLAPGYLTTEGLAPLPLDEDGFYRTGDAAVIRTRADGHAVFAFDGRLAEDFKLSNGVKIQAGRLRAGLLAHCAPLVEDIVIADENRDDLAALIFPAAPSAGAPDLPARIGHALAVWNEANRALSTAIARFAIAAAPPDRSRGEVSDKGQIVRSRFLQNHRALFDALYAGEGHAPKRLGAGETPGLSPDRETALRAPPETPSADAP